MTDTPASTSPPSSPTASELRTEPGLLDRLAASARHWSEMASEEEREAMWETQRRSMKVSIRQEIEDRANGLGTI